MELALSDDKLQVAEKRLSFFERYLTLWVALCMVAGVLIGRMTPSLVASLRGAEFGQDSHINLPIAVLIWLMIVPMMMKVEFARFGEWASDRSACWSRCSSIGWSSRSPWPLSLAVFPAPVSAA